MPARTVLPVAIRIACHPHCHWRRLCVRSALPLAVGATHSWFSRQRPRGCAGAARHSVVAVAAGVLPDGGWWLSQPLCWQAAILLTGTGSIIPSPPKKKPAVDGLSPFTLKTMFVLDAQIDFKRVKMDPPKREAPGAAPEGDPDATAASTDLATVDPGSTTDEAAEGGGPTTDEAEASLVGRATTDDAGAAGDGDEESDSKKDKSTADKVVPDSPVGVGGACTNDQEAGLCVEDAGPCCCRNSIIETCPAGISRACPLGTTQMRSRTTNGVASFAFSSWRVLSTCFAVVAVSRQLEQLPCPLLFVHRRCLARCSIDAGLSFCTLNRCFVVVATE